VKLKLTGMEIARISQSICPLMSLLLKATFHTVIRTILLTFEFGTRHRVHLEQLPTAPPRFPCTGNSGLQVDLSDKSDPLTDLRLFLDDDVVDTIVVETNRYADEMLGQ